MKKIFTLIVVCLATISSWAYDVEVDGIYYTLNSTDKTAEVTYKTTDYNSYSGSVTIPDTIVSNRVTYSVTSIGDNAFNKCVNLTSVTIPNSVTSIGESSFSICSGLTSIAIPNSVLNIGGNAFRACSGLTSITIPNSVKSLGICTFIYCSGLTSVIIGNSVTSIGNSTFIDCKSLKSITIGNSVTSIGEYAFQNCTGLTSVTIPNSVTSIGNCAFYLCSGLTSITFPNSVTSIGDDAFGYCNGLTSITIPNSVTSICGSSFLNCTGLTSVTVDVNNQSYCSEDNIIYSKDKSTLVYCMTSKKGELIIPNSVTSIGVCSFEYCTGLTSMTIPHSVTSIGSSAFYGCKGLKSLTIGNSVTSIGNYAFQDCSGLTSLIIGNSVTSIGNSAFNGCSGLTSVTIPNSVTSIGNGAFNNCTVKTVYWNANLDAPSYLFGSRITTLYVGDDVETLYTTFSSCSNLNKVVLGKNVKYIRAEAFKSCTSIKEFYVTGDEPPYLYPNVFAEDYLSNATLYVPEEDASYYQTTSPWSKFGKILNLDGDVPSVTKPKCSKPSIAYENKKLYFSTATPNATVKNTITCADVKSSEGTEIDLTATYNISAYAVRDGYDNSDTATATLVWATGTFTDGINEAKVMSVDALPLLISQEEGMVTVSGLNDGDTITAYGADGKQVAKTKAIGSSALMNLSDLQGKVAVLSVNGKSAKVMIK